MTPSRGPYAHSPNENGEWHDLRSHLESVAALAKQFAEPFGAGEWAYLAGLWHDLGKINPPFQEYLEACEHGLRVNKVPHAIWGAAWAYFILCRRLGRPNGWQEVAMSILGHHGGLADQGEAATRLNQWARAERASMRLLHEAVQSLPAQEARIPALDAARRELRLRMIFSALVDADFLDTERHKRRDRALVRGECTRPADLWHVFRPDQLRKMWLGRGAGVINQVRRSVFWDSIKAATKPPGVFRLTVPTGGGKTRAALAFALRHAIENRRHGFRRIIVALPYTSIIDQVADEYRQIFGDRLVLEHHSQVDLPEGEDQDTIHVAQRLASENWDHPLIVTTTVQLLESLLGNKPGRCRKLHNVARSIVVLDEVQTLPPELLAPTLDVLRSLVDAYSVTLVLSTATQPAFDQTPYLKAFGGLRIEEIVPRPERHFHNERMKRVEYQPVRQLESLADLVDELRHPRNEQVLIIVNTRRHAMELHGALLGQEVGGLYHLSTLLCGAHRRHLLNEIRSRLSPVARQPVRLISTQVVEAGVDLDFPVVYRALGPLDRIVQAAGRCNREGRLAKGQVVVFDWSANASPPGSYKVGLEDAKTLLSRNSPERLHDPALHTEYFQCLFRDVDLDKRRIQQYRNDLDYPEVAARYKLIEDTTPVVVPTYDHGEGDGRLREHLRSPSRESWQRLLPYVVNLRRHDLLRHAGMLEEVSVNLYRWLGPYDDKTHRGIGADAYDPVDLIQ